MRLRPLIMLAAASLLVSCGSSDTQKQRVLYSMDTYMTFTAYGENADKGLSAAADVISELDGKWSAENENSEINVVNIHPGQAVKVSADTASLTAFAKDMYIITDGALDISLQSVVKEWGFTSLEHHIPDDARLASLLKNTGADRIEIKDDSVTIPEGMTIGLGSVAKGAAGDIAAEELKRQGVESAILDLGGNIRTVGVKPDGSEWKVGIRDPFGDGIFGVLLVGETNIVTSGGYERYFELDGKRYWHILDPETGRPAESGIVSATAVGAEGRYCDALSTSMFVMGKDKAIEFWRSRRDFDLILVTDSREVLISEPLKESFFLHDGCDWSVTVIE